MATRARWALIFGVLMVALIGREVVEVAVRSVESHRLDRRLEALKHRQEQLAAERERLEHDATYVEGLIRSTFKQARKGEYVIPLEPGEAPPAVGRPFRIGSPR